MYGNTTLPKKGIHRDCYCLASPFLALCLCLSAWEFRLSLREMTKQVSR